MGHRFYVRSRFRKKGFPTATTKVVRSDLAASGSEAPPNIMPGGRGARLLTLEDTLYHLEALNNRSSRPSSKQRGGKRNRGGGGGGLSPGPSPSQASQASQPGHPPLGRLHGAGTNGSELGGGLDDGRGLLRPRERQPSSSPSLTREPSRGQSLSSLPSRGSQSRGQSRGQSREQVVESLSGPRSGPRSGPHDHLPTSYAGSAMKTLVKTRTTHMRDDREEEEEEEAEARERGIRGGRDYGVLYSSSSASSSSSIASSASPSRAYPSSSSRRRVQSRTPSMMIGPLRSQGRGGPGHGIGRRSRGGGGGGVIRRSSSTGGLGRKGEAVEVVGLLVNDKKCARPKARPFRGGSGGAGSSEGMSMDNLRTQEQRPKTPQWRRGVMRPLSCPTEDSPIDLVPLWEQGHHNMIPASLDEYVPSTCLVVLYVCVCVCVCVCVLGTGSCLLVADVCDCVCGRGHVIVVCGVRARRVVP